MIEANLTPTFITFVDAKGRFWKALALVAPLKSEDVDIDPVQLAETQDLELKVKGLKIVRR